MNPYDDEDTVDELPAPPRKEITAADRELLELAARALGAGFEEVDGEGYGNLHFEDGSTTYAWNPLVHSDDTFELQVRLHMVVEVDTAWSYAWYAYRKQYTQESHVDQTPVVATRRAVTRAAAEIGKKITG